MKEHPWDFSWEKVMAAGMVVLWVDLSVPYSMWVTCLETRKVRLMASD